jgi:hypothetical protein
MSECVEISLSDYITCLTVPEFFDTVKALEQMVTSLRCSWSLLSSFFAGDLCLW